MVTVAEGGYVGSSNGCCEGEFWHGAICGFADRNTTTETPLDICIGKGNRERMIATRTLISLKNKKANVRSVPPKIAPSELV